MKISTKLKFAAWVPGLMTFLVVGTLIVSFIELQQIQNEGSAVMDIRTHITELNHLVFNYIQYHDERPRQQFAGYHRDLTELIAGARVRGSDQQALLDTIRDNNEAMDQLFNQLVASFEYPASDPVQIQETESRLVGLLLQKSYEADISAAKLRRLVDAGIRRNEIITLGFILVIVLIATVPLSYILNRTRLGITTDLKRLNKGAAVIGSGNLDFQIDETSPDEIGELSRDFNRMTSALRSITASKQKLEKEIAERKRVEAARFEAEERLRFALDSSQTGAWDLDLIDHTAFRSLEHDRIFGYTELLPKWTHEIFLEHVVPEDRAAVDVKFRQAIETRGQWNFECRIRRTDGEIRWIWAVGRHQPDAAGVPHRMAGIVQDITERKLVEERLAEQAAMLANVNDAVIGYSVDNRITYWNRAAETIYGYSAAEALGKVGTILLRATYTSVTRDELVEKIARVGSIETESGRTAKDGRQLQIESHVIALRNSGGKITGYVAVDRDITERIKIQRALRVSEERYRSLFNTMSEGFGLHEIILDAAGKPCDYRFLELNDAFERLTGFPVKTSIGKTAKELLPGLEPYWIENYGRVALTGEPARFENYSASLGKWFETFSFSPAKNQFAVLFSDITERKKIEEALKESEEKYRTIIELANEGIWTTDAERKTTFANQRMAEMLGYTVDELMDKSPSEFLDPDQEPIRAATMAKLKAGIKTQQEFKFKRKDGSALWIISNASSILDEERRLKGTISILTDITERKKAEDNLREARDYLDNLFNYANAPIIVWNPDFEITRFNYAFERLTGRTAKEVLGKKLEVLFPDDSREHSMNLIHKTVFGERWETVEIPILNKDGTVHTVLWNSATLYDQDANATATIAQGQDITDRKKAEEELKQRTTELEVSNKELESFSYSVSHDLRAPLRSMQGFSSALLEDCADKLDDQGKLYLKYVQESSDLMSQLIDDLLKLSRVTRSEMNYDSVNLSEIVQKITDELQKVQPLKNLKVKIAPNISTFGDGNLIRLALENLLGNAWKFSGKTDSPHIEFGVTVYNDKQTYFIRDNGVGFDMTYADKLFKPFQRLHQAAEFSGTGIGLATVQRVIRRHGGQVWAEGKVGKGATFYFTLIS